MNFACCSVVSFLVLLGCLILDCNLAYIHLAILWFSYLINISTGGQSWSIRKTKWEKFCIWLAGSHLYIWFVFYVSLPNEIKLLLLNVFFFGINPSITWPMNQTWQRDPSFQINVVIQLNIKCINDLDIKQFYVTNLNLIIKSDIDQSRGGCTGTERV